jgi:riboflavin kinase / FMN adenylyltransferase
VKASILSNNDQEKKQSPVYNGMMSIGIRPTIGGTNKVIEVNLFDFNEDIYGKTMRVYVCDYLRSEVKFNGLEALQKQLDEDKKQSIQRLS